MSRQPPCTKTLLDRTAIHHDISCLCALYAARSAGHWLLKIQLHRRNRVCVCTICLPTLTIDKENIIFIHLSFADIGRQPFTVAQSPNTDKYYSMSMTNVSDNSVIIRIFILIVLCLYRYYHCCDKNPDDRVALSLGQLFTVNVLIDNI